MAGKYSIVRTKGDTFNFNFNVKTDTTPWDFTSYTAKFQVRPSAGSSTKLLDLSTGSGITMNSSGDVAITASASLMSFTAGRYVYDFQVTSAGGVTTTLLSGNFVLEQEVSR